jgi:hypothetical protein
MKKPSMDLSEMRIRVRSPTGEIESLTPDAIHERFGVRYATKLFLEAGCHAPTPFKDDGGRYPDEEQRSHLKRHYGLTSGRKGPTPQSVRNWLYAQELCSGQTADLYLAKVNDEVGYGVFAGTDLEPGDWVGEYIGLARHRGKADKGNKYLYKYALFSAIDARDLGNYTRWINHSKLHPNATDDFVFVNGYWHVVLVATAPIRKDQQVLFDYGDDYWKNETAIEFDNNTVIG